MSSKCTSSCRSRTVHPPASSTSVAAWTDLGVQRPVLLCLLRTSINFMPWAQWFMRMICVPVRLRYSVGSTLLLAHADVPSHQDAWLEGLSTLNKFQRPSVQHLLIATVQMACCSCQSCLCWPKAALSERDADDAALQVHLHCSAVLCVAGAA